METGSNCVCQMELKKPSIALVAELFVDTDSELSAQAVHPERLICATVSWCRKANTTEDVRSTFGRCNSIAMTLTGC